jgi:O-antigen ligase
MPLYVARQKVGPLSVTVLEGLIFLTILLYAGALYQSRTWTFQRTGLEIPLALFLIAATIAVPISPDHLGALGLYRAYFIEPVILFYIAVDLLRQPDDFKVLLAGFAAGAVVFALLNLGAWAVALAQHQVIATGNAPEALYTSPNAVAMFLEPPLALAAAFALYPSSRRERLIALGSFAVLVTATVLTLSRAGWLTVAVLVLVAVITIPQRRLKLALLAGAVIAGAAVSRIPYVAIRLAHQLDPNFRDNTFEGRLRIWSDTLHMLRDHPLFGAGLRAYPKVMVPYVTGGRALELYPHDVWLAMWSELGLLGLGAFIALMAILLWRGWRGFLTTSGFYRALLWGTAAGFVAIAVHGMFDTPYYKNDLAVEFWILAALEIAALRAIAAKTTGNGLPAR